MARFGRDITVIILGVLVALAFDNWPMSRVSHPDARRATHRAIIYNGLLQPSIA